MMYTISHKRDTNYRLKRYKEVYKAKGAIIFEDLEKAKEFLEKERMLESAIYSIRCIKDETKQVPGQDYLTLTEESELLEIVS